MRNFLLTLIGLFCSIYSAAIYRVTLLDHNEFNVPQEDIIQLPGYGLGIISGQDSIMLIDNQELAFIRWMEPNNARSIVGCGNSFYGAEGDSICRIATDTLPRKFVGRLDNQQFTLSAATDSTFYAITADEDFSCVYEINPETGYADPVISIEAPLLKIARMGENILLWVDDTIMIAKDKDNTVIPFYSDPNITDMELTPIGIFVGTDKSVIWFTGIGEGLEILKEGVSNLWWDSEDLLYYRTIEGDILTIVGLEQFYRDEIEKKNEKP